MFFDLAMLHIQSAANQRKQIDIGNIIPPRSFSKSSDCVISISSASTLPNTLVNSALPTPNMQMLTSRLRRAWGIQAYLRHATVSTKIVGDSRSMVSPIPRQICTLSRLPLYNRHQYTRYPPARRVCMSSNVTPVVVRDSTVKSLEGILMHTFKDRRLLVEAMTHRSVLNAKSSIGDIVFEDENGIMSNIEQNNEVLEHVGDRVFALLVSETLYKLNLFQSEGAMSALGHSLLSGKKADSYCE